MTTPPLPPGEGALGEAVIPRPDSTFPALRAALARVAPTRLPELIAERATVFTMATRSSSYQPIALYQLKWATVIEIERFPALARRLRAAEHAARSLDRDDAAWRTAMDEIRAITAAARARLTRE
ncbi:hypothetical protein H8N00_11765 [Streptomyces sp. AC563]|uniref:hypothetical protein n=1 Tax=Streptomyces buecherae TaxID=2763006 RepID=UPI00164E4C2F|nr:hypothetical protein [Streptomyces buecherae]MBC3989537.1 hypothetical protein [Streptomyces buecherae]